MRYGSNFRKHLEYEREVQLREVERTERGMLDAETGFRRLLPFDETPLKISNNSLEETPIRDAREEFREKHIAYCNAVSELNEITEELFEYPEDVPKL